MKKFDRRFIREMKKQLEVELIGVASVETSASRELKEKAASLLPGAKSVVVMGKEIYKEVVSLFKPSKGAGEAESGELFASHADYLNGRLNRAVHELAELLHKQGYRSLPLPAISPVDQRYLRALFSYKHAAQLAGLGSLGRHSLLITPEFGPRERLACLLTEAPLEPSPLSRKDYCRNCLACIKACPAQALHAPKAQESYSMNKFACSAYKQAGLACGVCLKVCDEVVGRFS